MSTLGSDADARRRLLEQRLRKAQAGQTDVPRVAPRPADVGVPLSSIQRRLWFLEQWQPGTAAYNIPVALALHGDVDTASLEQALRQLAQRHEVLRTVYRDECGEPVALMHADCDVPLQVIDCLPGASLDDMVTEATKEAARPFELAHEFPLRAMLWRSAASESLLLITLHHIAADGWSVGVLLRELSAFYRDARAGNTTEIALPALQYADFSYWQAQQWRGDALDRQLGLWQKRLAGAPGLLELPTDRPRPAVQGSSGAIESFRLDESTRALLKAVAAQERVTPFVIFLAALGALYQRYSGQGDMVIGTPVAGRQAVEWESLIGCFVNTLAMRVRPDKAKTARELFRQVKDEWLAVIDHQDLPFDKLVEVLAPERQFSHTPVFQVMLSVNNVLRATLDLDGVVARDVPIDTGTSKFDLSWAVDDLPDGLSGSVTYNTDLYDRSTVARMIGHLGQLLKSMLAQPDEPLACLDWLGEDERTALLHTFNDTGTMYPAARDVLELFAAHVLETPGAQAVIHEDARLSYRELDAESNRIAACLRSRGVGTGQRVGLYMERTHRTVAALLGILKAGAAYVPVDATYPVDRVRFMLEDAGASVCLTEAHLAAPLDATQSIRTLCVDRDAALIASHPDTAVPAVHRADDLMYVLFTSGSTGRPKGVCVEHRHYLNYLHGVMRRIDMPRGSHFTMVSTFAADLGTTMLYGALGSGGCVHVMSHARVTEPLAFADYMRRHRPDVLKLVPSHFETLCSMAPMQDLLPQRCLIFAGEACDWQTVDEVRAARPDLVIQNHYGPTETSVAALTYTVPAVLPNSIGTLPLGRPLGNVRAYVLDAHLQPVPVGIPGELHIGGSGVTRGYLGRPALTAERFVPDPFGPPGSRLYRTGDLARMRGDGTVEFLGRIDQQVKIRGYRVETAEIEALLTHQAAQEARVILREDTPGDRRLVAYLVMREDSAREHEREIVDALRARLREVLPDYMVPTAFVSIERLPLNANGKLDRFALPAPGSERHAAQDARLPRNALEVEIAAVWAALLGFDEFGIDENFFDLGGDSFKAVRAVRGIGRGLSVMDLFRHPTVALLAEHLAGAASVSEGLLHRLTPRDARADGVTWVCVPFGGGSAISYLALSQHVPESDALYAVELPGHDYARADDPLQPFDTVATQCAEEIQRVVQGPVLLYGHCLGAGMAVAIAQQLEARGVDNILGVVVGGSFPIPRLPGTVFDAISRVLPTDGLVSTRSILDGLLVTGGASGDEDPKELEFLVRNMRHDGRQAEDFYTRHYRDPDARLLDAPLVCVVGERDRATEFHGEEYLEWQRFSRDVSLEIIPGAGHFFQKHQARELAELGTRQARRWRNVKTRSADGAAPPASARQTRALTATLSTFLLVSLGQLVSVIGTGLSTFALGVWVYQQTGVVSDFAMMSALGILPGILVLPIAGAAADRWDRRKIMMICDLLGVLVVTATAALAWTRQLHVSVLYVVATLSAIASAFRQPAYTAAIAQLAPKRYLGHANGFVQLGSASGLLIGQMFGGVLMLRFGLDHILLLDIASYAIAFATLVLVRFPYALFRRQEEPFWMEVTQGWRYILKRHGMIALAVFFALGNCLASMVLVLVTPLVMASFSTATLGTVMAMNGAGMLVGSVAMSLWGGFRRRVVGMVGFVALFGASALVIAAGPAAAYPMAGMFGIGVCTAFINAHWLSLVQVKVGLELQGRVIAANQMLARSLMPLGTLLAGWLVDRVFQPLLADARWAPLLQPWVGTGAARGTAVMIMIVGVLSIALTALGLLYPPLRRLEEALPDAIPGAVILDKDTIQRQADEALARRPAQLDSTARIPQA